MGEAAAISVVSYLLYVASSLILYNVLPVKTGAAISSALLLATVYYLVWRTTGRPRECLRLRGIRADVAIYSVLASLALIPLAASVMAVLMSRFELPEEWLEAAYELVRAEDLSGLLYAWMAIALLASLGEEMVFRGVLQNALSARYSTWLAVLVASVVFAVLHVWRFPAALILGIFLGILYVLTGSLVAPILAHVTINSVVVIGSYALERAGPEALPDWIAQDAPAPATVLVTSVGVFALLMILVWKAAAAGRLRPNVAPDPGEGGNL